MKKRILNTTRRKLAFRLACRSLPIDATDREIMYKADQILASCNLPAKKMRAMLPPDDD